LWDQFAGFYRLPPADRFNLLQQFYDLSEEDEAILTQNQGLPIDLADRLSENVIGSYPIPFGVALYFRVNGRDHVVPMVIEESSVVAAASKAAKIALTAGGFTAQAPQSITNGQVQLIEVPDELFAREEILAHKEEVLAVANACDAVLVQHGGGAVDLQVRSIQGSRGPMLIADLLMDAKDAMGANTINTMLEAIAPNLETLSGGKACVRILSNLAVNRIATASATFPKDLIGGEEIVEKILWAQDFAEVDPFRAATHNKGILNGIIAVVQATGNDSRAIEAGAHAYAAYGHPYQPLTTYSKTPNGDLCGELKIPLMVGRIGGITSIHPLAKVAWKLLNVTSITEFYEVLAAVGLAQNFAALLALCTEGIQKGHMKLHASNIALMAGAQEEEVDFVVDKIVAAKKITVDYASEVLEELRNRDC
jgi:hydroxymethylglutaryl-CoA reductase